MNIELIIEDEFISFIDRDSAYIYDIHKRNLKDGNKFPVGYMSDYIYDLAPMNWMTRDMMMQFIGMIKVLNPDNDLDWEATQDYIDLFL